MHFILSTQLIVIPVERRVRFQGGWAAEAKAHVASLLAAWEAAGRVGVVGYGEGGGWC